MGLTQSQLQQLLPNAGYESQPFGVQPNGAFENGIDVTAPAGTPVPLLSAGTFLGSVSNGYVDVFGTPAGNEYYQHIDSVPLTVGQHYGVGTIIGTLDALTGNALASAHPGYSSSGPHLEFGLASQQPFANSSYINYANVDPTQTIINAENATPNRASLVGQGISTFLQNGLNASGGPPSAGQIGNAADSVVAAADTVGPSLPQLLQLPVIGGVSIGGTLALVGLGALGIVLVFALVKGGNSQ